MATQHVWEPLADDIIFMPSPNHGYNGQRPWWRAVTWHISQGSLEGTLGWLCNPVSNASAHLVIARNGQIYNLVDLDEPAWCQGRMQQPDLTNPIVAQTWAGGVNPNLRSLSIECVGMSRYWHGGALTDVQSAALQRATAYLCWRFRLTCDRTHILGHYQWDSVDRHDCPGFSADEWGVWIDRANALCKLWRGW